MTKPTAQIEPIQDRPHILVVDDDKRIRDLVARYLKENGYVAMSAEDAVAAQTLMERFLFDLLIVDVMMPGQDGVEFTQELRKKRDVPVLLLTALDETEDRIKGLESGADDYLTKPFDPRELILRLNSIIKRVQKPTKGNSKTMIGNMIFDVSQSILEKDGDAILLTDSESRLLGALATRAGLTIDRQELAQICDIDGGARAIDVQVTRLRRKIEEDSKKPRYLQTVRGKGYRLIAEEV